MGEYQLYIRVDEQQRIIDGYADWQTDRRADDEILLTDDGPRQFQVYWPEQLTNDRWQYRYKWTDGQRVERSQEELDAEWAAQPPAPKTPEQLRIEQLEAAIVSAQDALNLLLGV